MLTSFITLGDQVTELNYPAELSETVGALFGTRVLSAPSLPGHVISVLDTGRGEYSVSLNTSPVAENLSLSLLREALLEQVIHSLIVDLDSGVALHGASVAWQGKSILIIGPTGSGKTNLTGWFVANGFEFLSDELFVVWGKAAATSSVRRPLLAKPGSEELVEIFRQSGTGKLAQAGPNTIIETPVTSGDAERQAGLMIFPKFAAGSDLAFEFISPALAAVLLMQCNLNGRNLPDLGLSALTSFASNVPALRLTYGSFSQLDDVADKFAKLIVENNLPIAALKTMAAALRGPVTAAKPQQTTASAPATYAIPEETPRRGPKKLTIGMATYDDYDGVYFSLQSIRLFHPEILDDVEFLVIDNHPDGRCGQALKDLDKWIPNYRYVPKNHLSSTAIRNCVFEEADGDVVLCMDCHVLLVPGSLQKLLHYFDANPKTKDLLQGPLIYDDLKSISTHFEPQWRDGMFGAWGAAPEGFDPDAPPFEIPMQGLGLFVCRRDAWPGFNPAFRGFGGEEGYIHEKFRQRGARVLCLPFLRWLHRFPRPMGVPYPVRWEDRIRNYHIGFRELGWDTAPMVDHFKAHLGKQIGDQAVADMIDRASSSDLVQLKERDPTSSDGGSTRAIVCFIEDNNYLIQQAKALRHSWLHAGCKDTDLVVMGPPAALARIPDDVVKIEQRSVADDPDWFSYRHGNSVACLNGPNAHLLDRYSHILRTDADTFVTPDWKHFRPDGFVCSSATHPDDAVRENMIRIGAELGLQHRGLFNVGSTWYGPTALVRQTAALTEKLLRQFLVDESRSQGNARSDRHPGIALSYAGEIAVNHLAAGAKTTDQLDRPSDTTDRVQGSAHIRCRQTERKFSKYRFMTGRYSDAYATNLDLDIIADYAMEMSVRSIARDHAIMADDRSATGFMCSQSAAATIAAIEPGDGAVPKVLHQIVFGGVVPPHIAEYMRSWREVPGYRYRLWEDEEIERLIAESYPQWSTIYHAARNYGEKGDIARYAILHRHGGVYVDWDIEIIDPDAAVRFLDRACQKSAWGLIDRGNGTLATEFMGVPPAFDLIGGFMQHISEIPLDARPFAADYTGPWGLGRYFEKLKACPIVLYPFCSVFKYSYHREACPSIGQPFVHHWVLLWIKQDSQTELTIPST